MMLQQDEPEDYVIASGIQYSVRDFVEYAANEIDLKITWNGNGVDEQGFTADGRSIIKIDPRYFRPTEVETLLGDASKAREKLGWTPKTRFEDLVKEMMQSDMKQAENERMLSTNK
jgi:GDPmannose 4,6-dehydratase